MGEGANRLVGSSGRGFNARNAHIKDSAEAMGAQYFNAKTNSVTVAGIIVAGCGNLKDDLVNSPFLNGRVKAEIKGVVEVSYGGTSGFHEAVKKSSKILCLDALESETKLVDSVMAKMLSDPNTVGYGFEQTFSAIQAGLVHTVILSWKSKISSKKSGKSEGVFDDSDKLIRRHCVSIIRKSTQELVTAKCHFTEDECRQTGKKFLAEIDEKTDNFTVKIEPTKKFLRHLCDANGVKLELIGMHSPETCRFAAAFGCVSLFHYSYDLGQDNGEDEDDEWLSDSA
jgi:peptide subunit release factor 1 (eRF1)